MADTKAAQTDERMHITTLVVSTFAKATEIVDVAGNATVSTFKAVDIAAKTIELGAIAAYGASLDAVTRNIGTAKETETKQAKVKAMRDAIYA